MVEKRVVKPLKPKMSKIVFRGVEKVIKPPKFKTRKHKRTIRRKR